MDAHVGHGGLRKTHQLFNVFRADVYGEATSNFGNHQGQHHAEDLRVHSVFFSSSILNHGDDGLVELVPHVDLLLHGHAFHDVVGDRLGFL